MMNAHNHHHPANSSLSLSPNNYEEIECSIFQYFLWRMQQTQQQREGNHDVDISQHRYHTIVDFLQQELLLPSDPHQQQQSTELPEICIHWIRYKSLEQQQRNGDNNDNDLISQQQQQQQQQQQKTQQQQHMEEDVDEVVMAPQQDGKTSRRLKESADAKLANEKDEKNNIRRSIIASRRSPGGKNRKTTVANDAKSTKTKRASLGDDDNVPILQLLKTGSATASSRKRKREEKQTFSVQEDHDEKIKKKMRSNDNQYVRTTRSGRRISPNTIEDTRRSTVESPTKKNQSFESKRSHLRGYGDEEHSKNGSGDERDELNLYQRLSKQRHEAASNRDHDDSNVTDNDEDDKRLSPSSHKVAVRKDMDDDDDEEQRTLELLEYQALKENEYNLLKKFSNVHHELHNTSVKTKPNIKKKMNKNDASGFIEKYLMLQNKSHEKRLREEAQEKTRVLKEKLAKQKLIMRETITKRKEIKLRKTLQKESDEVKRKMYKWEERYEQLLEFYNERGHSRIPASHFLYKWIKDQRKDYRLQSAKLTPERIAKLEALGFNWSPSCGNRLTFLQFFDKCKEYIAKYGNCNVPNQLNQLNDDGTEATEDDKRLRMWARMLRESYHNKQNGMQSVLDKKRINMLDSIGFVWGVQRQSGNEDIAYGGGDVAVANEENDAISFSGRHHDRFLDRIEQLRKVKEICGSCSDKKNILSVYPNNPEIYLWVRSQRRDYRKWKMGQSSALNEERRELLRSLGFDFSPRKHYAAPNPNSARNLKRRSQEQTSSAAPIKHADYEEGLEQDEEVDSDV